MKEKINTAASAAPYAERGASLVFTMLVMTLMLGFVALMLSRVTSESQVSNNDAAEARTLAVSEAGLEDATRDFATVMEHKLNPSENDLKNIREAPVEVFSDNYEIKKNLKPVGTPEPVTIQSGAFQGLYSLRDQWQVNVSAREKNSDVKVETMRRFYNNRIPLFQFGAFYQDDLELNRPPLFTFSGKVHSNSNIFLSAYPVYADGGIYFKSKVTAAGEIVNDIWKTGTKLASPADNSGDVYFPDADGTNQKLTVGNGSVKCTSDVGGILKENGGRGRAFPYPNCVKNAGWSTFAQRFEGNLVANTKELRLPVDRLNVPLIEIVRRGKNIGDKVGIGGGGTTAVTEHEDRIISEERYANKEGLRISLADSKDKLPGCASAKITDPCGVRLDAKISLDGTLGYQPLPMLDSATYKTTAVNGSRLAISGREVWIKVEKVEFDNDNGRPIAADITEDILSLGMTEPVESGLSGYIKTGYASGQDSRSIIKIQRFYLPGAAIPEASGSYQTNLSDGTKNYNFVGRYKITSGTFPLLPTSPCFLFVPVTHLVNCNSADAFAPPLVKSGVATVSDVEAQHYKLLCINTSTNCDKSTTEKYLIVPFPIQMYDPREGNRADSGSGVTSGYAYQNGVMSLIDIDVKNLREFLKGTWDGKFPITTAYAKSRGNVGLKSTDIKDNRGWVVYFSDRRGDYDFDGRYKMEDVNPKSNNLIDEDLDNNGAIDTDYSEEAPALDSTVEVGLASVTDHAFYRRGVRLINAELIPGKYDSVKEENTKGFTFASENGVYVLGNYNVQNVILSGGSDPASATNYFPQNTTDHIPSSIVGDSVTVLSKSWNDANSFTNPFDRKKRVAEDTKVRFAMIAGDSLTARTASATNGDFDGLNGGLHNFMRFLENWDDKRLNYSGSLINLFNSFNNNGKWKCCTTVYYPPTRDWTFDNTFINPNRLPPGSPYVYYLSFTGFQRVDQ